jgi:DNA-binding CsgD family transcriptional regulator
VGAEFEQVFFDEDGQMESQSEPTPQVAAGESEPALSARQIECLYWVQEGKSAGDIGQILGLSGRTIEYHLAKACDALGVRTRVQAVVRARDSGWLQSAQRTRWRRQ